MSGWNFPSNNHGTVYGIGEAGIETFKGSPYRSLAREICQNSLDARSNHNRPVTVEFAHSMIRASDIPQFEALKSAFLSCKNFWQRQNSEKTVSFFDRALQAANSETISLLRISDFNTTGLTGSDAQFNTPWQNLVKASGVSDKSGSSGGSFGIGKSAPFACSIFRTVFYSTLDKNKLKACQGVARLVSFDKNPKDAGEADITTGIGYYGETEKNSAIIGCLALDRTFTRTKFGTDVFILGFDNKPGWEDDIIRAVLDDFLCSIYSRNLAVRVGSVTISSETLPGLMEKYRSEDLPACHYYQVLTSPDAETIEYDFPELGKIELSILLKSDLNRRRVMMCRSSGMKICEQKGISAAIQFAGICILKDENINSYFREMENPQHDAWEPERHSNPKQADKKYKELRRYIKSSVIERGRNTPVDEIDADGVGEFLPDEIAVSSEKSSRAESIRESTKEIDVAVSALLAPQKGSEHYEDADGEEMIPEPGTETSAEDESSAEDACGADEKGTSSALSGRNSSGAGRSAQNKFDIKIINIRLFVTDLTQHKYRLIFTPTKDAANGFLQLQLSGEQNSADVAVKHANLVSSGKMLSCKNNRIMLGAFVSGQKISIDFIIDYSEQCSMEVKLYGYPFKTLSVPGTV